MASDDSLHIEYEVPLAGGHVSLDITIDHVKGMATSDQEFLVEVLAKVGAFAASVATPLVVPELPAVLRGVGGRP